MDILIYLMKVNLGLIAFYAFYWVFLRKNTFFTANRMFLMLSVAVSFLLPFLKVKHNYDFSEPLPLSLNELPLESIRPIVYQTQILNFNWIDVLTFIYLTGAVLLATRFIYSMYKVYALLIDGDPIGEEETRSGRNYWLLRSNEAFSSYSFFNFLILNREDVHFNRNIITDHEEVHIGQWHSFDVLLIELVQVFCWFNPVVIFYKESFRKLHEFIADDIVDVSEKAEYAEFLFAYNFRTNASSLGNNFFKDSLLKERIVMMMKKRSTVWASLRYVLIIPMLLILGYFVVAKDIRRGDLDENQIEKNRQ
ncbi:M56 family metallopeptidase [Emticicia sp. SJ17W-69]|uniref:M56 family metallopeptidase n=1 Tax=Emticicia sp. SJ17W-69 TaxID=3421657 RepID=UPI003EBAA8A4